MSIKLGKRLTVIESLIVQEYDHIWDCCCDHGFLGCYLLETQPTSQIHFVDIVHQLMTTLQEKLILHQKKSSPSRWSVHCLDVASLPLQEYQGTHLVIIAGVGGDLMCHFIQQICQRYLKLQIDFILCPVHHQYCVRQNLIDLDFSLTAEVLVKENKRYYEILHVSYQSEKTDARRPVNVVGDDIWDNKTDADKKIARDYLDNTIAHYKRVQKSGKNESIQARQAYEACLKKLNN